MDEHRNQYSDEQNGHQQAQPSESSYNPEAPSGDQHEQPPYGQAQNNQTSSQQWQNDRHPWPDGSQNSQQQWQNGPHNSQQWQNTPPNSQQYWQNSSPNSQQQWQNGPQNNQPYWQNGPQNSQQYWQDNPQNNQQYWQDNPQTNQQYWQNGQVPPKRNNLALASMITGIFALITCCIPLVQFPLAVTAIVLVILSKKKQPLSGFAIAGLVMGILAILISIVMVIYMGAYLRLMNDPEFSRLLNEMLEMYQ